ncbi:hypothetical protein OESDEN_20116, partial [Oesophagostomum dentatum]
LFSKAQAPHEHCAFSESILEVEVVPAAAVNVGVIPHHLQAAAPRHLALCGRRTREHVVAHRHHFRRRRRPPMTPATINVAEDGRRRDIEQCGQLGGTLAALGICKRTGAITSMNLILWRAITKEEHLTVNAVKNTDHKKYVEIYDSPQRTKDFSAFRT